jgi:Tol biopolymer transport system component/DNA-binding SARP family transcriptional activator
VVRSPKRLALLSYLAAASPHGFHRRDTLLGLFWPESDQKRARGALRQTVRHLRSDLGDVVVSRGQEELGLDWDRFWCDAVAFEEALDEGRVPDAIELYQRDLLDGFYLSGTPEFERWLDRERRRLQRRGAEAAWAFAGQLQEPSEAARWARRAARFTPRGETAVRRLMQFLDARGDAVGALREYERFRVRVHEELGAGPGSETAALATAIREGTNVPTSQPAKVEGEAPKEGPTSPELDDEASAQDTSATPRRRGLALPVSVGSTAPIVASRALTGETATLADGIHSLTQEIEIRPHRLSAFEGALMAVGIGVALLATLGTARLINDVGDGIRFRAAMRITDSEGLEIQPALSPSGDRVAYVTGQLSATRVEVRRVSGGRPVRLTSELRGTHRSPTWSPDGERVAFITHEVSGASTLYAVPATGGAPRVLLRAEPSPAGLWGLSWSPDGRRIALKRDRSLYTLDTDTGELTHLTDAWAPHSLAWSPRGDRIAFVSENSGYPYGSNIAPSSVWVVPAIGGEARRITSGGDLNQSPVWWPDGRRLLFISDRDGTPDIYSQRLDDSSEPAGSPVRLTSGLQPLSFSLSADGSRLTYSVPTVDADIWVLPMHEGNDDQVPPRLADATRLLDTRQVIETVSLSPDGAWLAYDSNASGNQDIYKVSVDGGEPIQLTRDPADDFAPEWSPDGSELVFYSFRSGNRDLFVTDADGRRVEQVTTSDGSDAFPSWSPDGDAIVYQHNPSEAPGDFQTLRRVERDRPGADWSPPVQLNRTLSGRPRSSPDGRWIAYWGLGNLSVLSVTTGEESVLLRGASGRGAPVWSADSESLLFAARLDGVSAIWRIPRTGGQPQPVAVDGGPAFVRFWFDTDGEEIVFTRLESQEADIWVVELEGHP